MHILDITLNILLLNPDCTTRSVHHNHCASPSIQPICFTHIPVGTGYRLIDVHSGHAHLFQSAYNWASARENLSSGVCEQHRRRPACASAQTDQRLFYSLIEKYHISTCYERNFNFLASLCS